MGLPLEHAYDFTDQQFQKLRDLVYLESGIALADIKKELVYGRLFRRIRSLKLNGFDDYLALLEHHPQQEMGDFINAITTNLTGFFREEHHFDYLQEHILSWLYEQHRLDRRIRIWSAGCSTGEEPYSIVMSLLESIPDPQNWDIKILATDIDSQVLSHASEAVYDRERVEKLDAMRQRRWFVEGKQDKEGKVIVKDELRRLVSFEKLNLVQGWGMKNQFDVVFCRNVVIYFDKTTQSTLFERFAGSIRQEGFLIIGHSETLFNVSDKFQLIGKTIYRKAS